MLVAIGAGVLTLAAYFLPIQPLPAMRQTFVEWASVLAGIALMAGVLNLVSVHFRKTTVFAQGWVYSTVLVLSFVAVFGIGLLGVFGSYLAVTQPYAIIANGIVQFAFNYLQVPIEASLAAVLAVVLITAGTRLIRRKRHWTAVLFVIIAIVLVFGFVPTTLPGLDALVSVREWIMQVPGVAGGRGILLGVALGAVTTGLRVLVGADRQYGE